MRQESLKRKNEELKTNLYTRLTKRRLSFFRFGHNNQGKRTEIYHLFAALRYHLGIVLKYNKKFKISFLQKRLPVIPLETFLQN